MCAFSLFVFSFENIFLVPFLELLIEFLSCLFLKHCVSGWLGTHYLDQASLKFRETHDPPLPPKSWIKGEHHHILQAAFNFEGKEFDFLN